MRRVSSTSFVIVLLLVGIFSLCNIYILISECRTISLLLQSGFINTSCVRIFGLSYSYPECWDIWIDYSIMLWCVLFFNNQLENDLTLSILQKTPTSIGWRCGQVELSLHLTPERSELIDLHRLSYTG